MTRSAATESLDFKMLIQLITIVTIVGGGFYFTGQVTRTLEQLEKITTDHELRIRELESQ